jgi:hypothetical protein
MKDITVKYQNFVNNGTDSGFADGGANQRLLASDFSRKISFIRLSFDRLSLVLAKPAGAMLAEMRNKFR